MVKNWLFNREMEYLGGKKSRTKHSGGDVSSEDVVGLTELDVEDDAYLEKEEHQTKARGEEPRQFDIETEV